MKKSIIKVILIRLVYLFLISVPFQVQAALDVIACFEYKNGGKLLQGTQGQVLPIEFGRVSPPLDNQDCILINSVAYNAEQTINIGATKPGVAGGAGKVTFNPLTLVKDVDFLSPSLFVKMASGEYFKAVNMFFFNQSAAPIQGAGPTLNPVMQLQLGLAYIKSISVSAETGQSLGNNESVQLEYAEIVTTVYGQDSRGGRTQIKQGWDRVKNVSITKSANIVDYILP
jgi:type VI protein secretion system component Hcp